MMLLPMRTAAIVGILGKRSPHAAGMKLRPGGVRLASRFPDLITIPHIYHERKRRMPRGSITPHGQGIQRACGARPAMSGAPIAPVDLLPNVCLILPGHPL